MTVPYDGRRVVRDGIAVFSVVVQEGRSTLRKRPKYRASLQRWDASGLVSSSGWWRDTGIRSRWTSSLEWAEREGHRMLDLEEEFSSPRERPLKPRPRTSDAARSDYDLYP